MIDSLGEVVVEGELLARELLTLYHSLDVEEGRKVWEYLWRGGRLKVNHMFLSRITGDERDGDLKVQFNDMFGNAITIFVYVHLMCVLCCVVCVCVCATHPLPPPFLQEQA